MHTDTYTNTWGMARSVSLCLSLLRPNLLDSSFVFISRIFCWISNEINIYILNKSSRGEGGILHRMSVTFSRRCFTSCIRFIGFVYCHSKSSSVLTCIEMYCKAHTQSVDETLEPWGLNLHTKYINAIYCISSNMIDISEWRNLDLSS